MPNYIGLIHKEADSDYGVSFPDFAGCVTAGVTLDEARAFAQEALAFHIEGMIEDGQALPEPSTLEAVMTDPENRRAVAVLVPWSAPTGKAVRVNITLPEDALRAIDRYAEAHGLTRSAFLANAARQAMKENA